MTIQVTQCPSCGTSFRFTDAQLDIANGAVRCGSCLNIFQAREHTITSADSASALAVNTSPTDASDTEHLSSITSEKSAQIAGSENDQSTIDNSAVFSDTGGQDILDNIFDDDIFADDTSLDSLADELMATNRDQTPFSADDDSVFEFDDNVASTVEENLFDDTRISDDSPLPATDDNELQQRSNSAETSDFSHSFLGLEQDDDATAAFIERHGAGDGSDVDEDSWANKLFEEEMEEDYKGHEFYQNPDNVFEELEDEEDDYLDPELQDLLNQRDENYDQSPPQEEEFAIGSETLIAGNRIGEDKQALLANIEPEPVEFTGASLQNRWAKRAWTASIAAALALLFFQYVASNFDTLARDDKYRSILTSGCSFFGCTLPKNDDVGLIRSSNLLVRSHPEIQQALVVDAVIVNRADFKQSFPVMELRFTNLEGNVVAGRNFDPEEYLAGELSGQQIMPVRQPVHISLEIVDPGEQAVNYELYFHPREES
ncbi:MAG: DUF3426 domain-containing protein [Oceanicoccus sp.]